jgi:serine/threonine-protein kinase
MVPPDAPAAVEIDAALEVPADAAMPDPGSVEMDPNTAEDMLPEKGSAQPVEEEDHAPQTPEQVDQRLSHTNATNATVAPHPTTLAEAVQMIRDGKRDEALASLRALAKKQPGNANIPWLIGNLYVDRRWWGIALDEYGEAIKRSNGAYRNNPTLIKNVIKMLASGKTSGKAATFLRKSIGHPAAPYLRNAAAHDPNPTIKRTAGYLARQIR